MVYAAEGGHLQIVEWLIARGVSVDNSGKNGVLSIAHFAAGGDHEQLLRWLVKNYPHAVQGQVQTRVNILDSIGTCTITPHKASCILARQLSLIPVI